MSTKVFEVLPDYAYQGLAYDGRDDPYDERFAPLSFDGTRRADLWEPPPLFSPWPEDPEGDIWHSIFPVLGDSETAAALQPVLLCSADLLPLPYEGRVFHAINVITVEVE